MSYSSFLSFLFTEIDWNIRIDVCQHWLLNSHWRNRTIHVFINRRFH